MRNLEKRIETLETGTKVNTWQPNQPEERNLLHALADALGGGDFWDHEAAVIALGRRVRAGELTDDDRRIFKLIEDEEFPEDEGTTIIEVIAEMGRLLETVR